MIEFMRSQNSPAPIATPQVNSRSPIRLSEDNKDVLGFLTVLEAQLSMKNIPVDEWKTILIDKLDSSHMIKVASLVADPDSTYVDFVKEFKCMNGETSVSCAQMYFSPEPNLTKFKDVQTGMGVLSQ